MREELTIERLLPRMVSAKTISRNGYRTTLQLLDDEKKNICDFYNLSNIVKFEADIELVRLSTTKLALKGHLKAKVHQPCVVTLQAVETIIDEEISTVLVPEQELDHHLERRDDDGALMVSLDIDVPDTYHGTEINLGVFVLEYMSLGLNSYPRIEEAELPSGHDDGEFALKPFAKLAVLQDKLKPN